MTNLGPLQYYLGIEIHHQTHGIFIYQSKYATKILEEFNMTNCKATPTPMCTNTKLTSDQDGKPVDATLYWKLVGNLIYLTSTRLDIVYAVGIVSRYMSSPKESYWKAAKHILRCVQGAKYHGIQYNKKCIGLLSGYSDSDSTKDPNCRKPTIEYCFDLDNRIISWRTKKQSTVSLSTTKVEYQTTIHETCEAIWLRRLLEELNHPQHGPSQINCDNQSTI